MAATKKPRVRRDPETARATILDAAERVFVERGPDVAGLKDVAKAAGVSHALVSHYFGSYDALVEETLARRIGRVREAMLRIVFEGSEDEAADAILDRLASMADDRVTVRLAGWAFLTKRTKRADFFAVREKGLAHMISAVEARKAARKEAPIPRRDIELAAVSVIAMVMWFALAKEALLGGLGYAPGSQDAKAFEAEYRDHVRAFTKRALRKR